MRLQVESYDGRRILAPRPVVSVAVVPDGGELEFEVEGASTVFRMPRLDGHARVGLQF